MVVCHGSLRSTCGKLIVVVIVAVIVAVIVVAIVVAIANIIVIVVNYEKTCESLTAD